MKSEKYIKDNLRNLKLEFITLTGASAGVKPYQYNDKVTKEMNIYVASILGAIVVYETILDNLMEK